MLLLPVQLQYVTKGMVERVVALTSRLLHLYRTDDKRHSQCLIDGSLMCSCNSHIAVARLVHSTELFTVTEQVDAVTPSLRTFQRVKRHDLRVHWLQTLAN